MQTSPRLSQPLTPKDNAPLVDRSHCDNEIDPPIEEGLQALRRLIDDRLFVNVEAGVDQHGKTGLAFECAENVVIKRVSVPFDDLRTRRPVDMNHGGDPVA